VIAYLLGGLGLGIIIGIWFMWWSTVRHRRTPSLTKYVVFSITVLIAYIIAEMIVSTRTGVSHPDLSTLVGSTFGGEILFCALIKIFKLKEDNNNNE
jgi:hypothetical protein